MTTQPSTPSSDTPPAHPRRPRRASDVILGVLGDLFITLGCLLLLFVVWQLFWTDVVADADAHQTVTALEEQFTANAATEEPAAGSAAPDAPDFGEAYAIVYIPRFGSDYARPLYEGTDRDTLSRGIGHYTDTAGVGEVGNFSLAGHRTTYGKPFNAIDELTDGDAIIVRTVDAWTVYRVTSRAIVRPTDVEVIAPVPDQPGETPTAAMVTLTSCHPEFSARERYIVHGELEATYAAEADLPSDLWEVN